MVNYQLDQPMQMDLIYTSIVFEQKMAHLRTDFGTSEILFLLMRNSSHMLTGEGAIVVKREKDTPLPSTATSSKGLVRVKSESDCTGFVARSDIPIKDTIFYPVRILVLV